jgi:hypothetical protein
MTLLSLSHNVIPDGAAGAEPGSRGPYAAHDPGSPLRCGRDDVCVAEEEKRA